MAVDESAYDEDGLMGEEGVMDADEEAGEEDNAFYPDLGNLSDDEELAADEDLEQAADEEDDDL